MELWNIASQKRIYAFPSSSLLTTPSLPLLGAPSFQSASISSLVQSPAIDVVGIGFTSGEISVYDVRADERLMRMRMDPTSSSPSAISALAFRSDSQPILASASSSGHIALWDLNAGGRLLHMVKGAHDSAIRGMEWVPGQPVLVTSGEDNSVKQWVFDTPTAAPRLLKFRSGHHAPPHLIRYYGDDGKALLTASRDRSLRCTSVVRDSRSFELSQGSVQKKANSLGLQVDKLKFPAITSLSYSPARAKDWDDIMTGHTDETFARTWTMQSKRLGKHTLGFAGDAAKSAKGKEKATLGSVKATCVTACGNFGLAGSSTGQVYMWNMQSGIRRRVFKIGNAPEEVSGRVHSSNAGKKERSVTGIVSDSLNQWVVVSTLDGTVNVSDTPTAQFCLTMLFHSSSISDQPSSNTPLSSPPPQQP
jgi:U3 small nucleolar RNA-associated protein 21